MLPSLTTPEAIADQSMIAQQVFLAMAGMELTTAGAHPNNEEPLIESVLYYKDSFEGAILIECSPALAFAFTSRLMSIETPSVLDEDVIDAMGELVNMIGGNLKGLMSPETCISTPVVLRSDQLNELIGSSKRLSQVCLASDFGHCWISLLQTVQC